MVLSRSAVIVFALMTVLCVHPVSAAAQGKTQKISKKLVSRAEDMVKELEKTRSQVVKTVAKYNDIFAKTTVKDRQKAYKDLNKEIKKTEDRVKDARKRSDSMHKEAEKFFNEWFKGLAKVTDGELRALSQANMTESRDQYYKTIDTGLKAAEMYGALATDLKNQVSYLNLDMSDAAMSKLMPSQAKTSVRVTELYQAVDEMVKATKGYIGTMK